MISAGQTMAVRTIEPAAMAVLFPRVSGNKKEAFYMDVGTCGVFGNCVFLHFFGTRRLCHDPAFPDTFNSRAVRIQRFQRIDVILTGVWILSAFIKISFMLYLSSYIASRSFSAKYKKYIYLLSERLL